MIKLQIGDVLDKDGMGGVPLCREGQSGGAWLRFDVRGPWEVVAATSHGTSLLYGRKYDLVAVIFSGDCSDAMFTIHRNGVQKWPEPEPSIDDLLYDVFGDISYTLHYQGIEEAIKELRKDFIIKRKDNHE